MLLQLRLREMGEFFSVSAMIGYGNVGEGFIPSLHSVTGNATPRIRNVRRVTTGGDQPRPLKNEVKALPFGTYL